MVHRRRKFITLMLLREKSSVSLDQLVTKSTRRRRRGITAKGKFSTDNGTGDI